MAKKKIKDKQRNNVTQYTRSQRKLKTKQQEPHHKLRVISGDPEG